MTPGRTTTVPERGDVILVPFPFAELTAKKARPAVVVSSEAFFQAERKIIVAAITSNVKAHGGPTNLQLTRWRACGLLKLLARDAVSGCRAVTYWCALQRDQLRGV